MAWWEIFEWNVQVKYIMAFYKRTLLNHEHQNWQIFKVFTNRNNIYRLKHWPLRKLGYKPKKWALLTRFPLTFQTRKVYHVSEGSTIKFTFAHFWWFQFSHCSIRIRRNFKIFSAYFKIFFTSDARLVVSHNQLIGN